MLLLPPPNDAVVFALTFRGLVLLTRPIGLNGQEEWALPGGPMRPGETPQVAAKRQLRQLGLMVHEVCWLGINLHAQHNKSLHAYGGRVLCSHLHGFVPDTAEPAYAPAWWAPLHMLEKLRVAVPFAPMWDYLRAAPDGANAAPTPSGG